MSHDARHVVNELIVDIFKNILDLEEKYHQLHGIELSMTEIHTLDSIQKNKTKPMSDVAKSLNVTQAGVFVPRNLDDDLLLLGAGSGITPLMAILQAALVEGSGQVRLFYASRDAASLIFAEELAEWSARYPDRLQLRIWLDAEQG